MQLRVGDMVVVIKQTYGLPLFGVFPVLEYSKYGDVTLSLEGSRLSGQGWNWGYERIPAWNMPEHTLMLLARDGKVYIDNLKDMR